MSELPKSARKVQDAADGLNLEIHVLEMPESTRTAPEAAAACGCELAQIVKSLVFKGTDTGKPYLFLVSGANRVDTEKVAASAGEPLGRADADYVRDVTGYAIGGIPPFGHARELPTFIDTGLLTHDTIWAAAGTPKCLFSVRPKALQQAIGAEILEVC